MSGHLREAIVDLDAIRDNVSVLKQHAGSAGVMAVVKADAYGHGLLPSSRAALAGGASWLGVALVEEALQLRAAGLSEPILAWLTAPGERWHEAIDADVDLSIGSTWVLRDVQRAAAELGRPARIHLKVDTGLGRGGAASDTWTDLVSDARKAEADGLVHVVGVWSHLAYADDPGHPTTDRQLLAFSAAVAEAESVGLQPQVRHLANSAATLTRPDLAFDLVRPGLAIYGLSPVPDHSTPRELGLRPAMALQARVSQVKRVPKGHGVSYAHRYVTDAETTLALIPLGYADGIPRNATNVGPVWAAGRRRVIAGAVCMDQCVVDVGDDSAVEGDLVTLFGSGDDGVPTAEDWAAATDTISYEIVTRIGSRVRRRYVGAD